MISFIVNTVLWVCEYGAVTMLVLLVSVMIGYLMTRKSHFPFQFCVPDRVGAAKKTVWSLSHMFRECWQSQSDCFVHFMMQQTILSTFNILPEVETHAHFR